MGDLYGAAAGAGASGGGIEGPVGRPTATTLRLGCLLLRYGHGFGSLPRFGIGVEAELIKGCPTGIDLGCNVVLMGDNGEFFRHRAGAIVATQRGERERQKHGVADGSAKIDRLVDD